MMSMDAAVRDFRLEKWFWVAAIWFGLGLFDATQTVFVMRAEGMHHAWGRLFVTGILSWLPWAAMTPLVLWLGRRYPLTGWRPLPAWPVHFTACVFAGLLAAAWIALLELWLNPWAKTPPPAWFVELWMHRFYNQLLSAMLLYIFILVVSYVLESRERLALQQTERARLNEQLSQAQLRALRHQMEPHFLFNTLNGISGLIREKRNDDAVNMIAGLSDLLRQVLQNCQRQEIPLGEEIEFAQKYLEIQKTRFGDRMRVSIEVPGELLPAYVPSLMLQPMVENAVKHGIAKRAQGGAIRIAAARSNGRLSVKVSNDGPPLAAGGDAGEPGIGISNVRTRLQSLYGSECELVMRNREAEGVEVTVTLPFRKE